MVRLFCVLICCMCAHIHIFTAYICSYVVCVIMCCMCAHVLCVCSYVVCVLICCMCAHMCPYMYDGSLWNHSSSAAATTTTTILSVDGEILGAGRLGCKVASQPIEILFQ